MTALAGMSALQIWLVAGLPALLVSLFLFVARSQLAQVLALAVLLVGFALVTAVDHTSGAVFGALLALVYATGRGHVDRASPVPDVMPDTVHDEGHGHVGAEA